MKKELLKKVKISIRDLNKEGDGVGDHQGFTIFAPKTLPGEIALVQLKTIKKNYGIGQLVKLMKTSSSRVIPPCPYFDRCGGCQIMHLSYQGQIQIKENRIKQAFLRVGKLKSVQNISVTPSPKNHHYRNKIQMPFCFKDNKLSVSLYASSSHDKVAIERCLIHNRLGENIVQPLIKILDKYQLKPLGSSTPLSILKHLLIRTSEKNRQILIVLITHSKPLKILKKCAQEMMQINPDIKGVVHHENTRDDNVILDQKFTALVGQDFILESIGHLSYKISAPSFFQVNTDQAENLYKKALEFGELKKSDIVVDAYSGIGSLTLFLASHVAKVIGIECVEKAVFDAKENACFNQINNVDMLFGDVKDLLSQVNKADVIYLNPPRKGCDKLVLQQILQLSPRTIVYISCDPTTLARDAAILCAAEYTVEKIEGFDMFPQTMHVETCVQLKKRD